MPTCLPAYLLIMWFTLALIGYFFLAAVFVLDKFILTKSVHAPAVYTFYSTIFMLGALIALPFGAGFLQGMDWVWAILSGVAFGLGLWAMFRALGQSEASHMSPFIGATVTLATYFFSGLLLGERLTGLQQIGIGCLVAGCILLSQEKSQTHSGLHRGFLWGAVAGILFAVSHVSAKYLYEIYPFLTGFVWTRAATGLVGLGLLLAPAVRMAIRLKVPKSRETKEEKYALPIVVVDKCLGVAGVILIQYASALGSVTLVNALAGVQYVLMFLLIFFFTKYFPKLFQEYFTKREIAFEVAALVFMVVGSVLFVL